MIVGGPAEPVYEQLDANEIVRTIARLVRRIEERFPDANLVSVARRLEEIASGTMAQIDRISRPNLALRVGVVLLLASVVVVLALFIPELRVNWKIQAISELVQTVEGLLGSLFFIGTGIVFLVTLEGRLKRGHALEGVHQLRSLAHIVDMHQLTKDPDQLVRNKLRTESSPERTMTDFELLRYLDYCSEMLALISKVAAIYVQRFADPVVLASVDEIEDLTTGLQSKIWQKITIIDQVQLHTRTSRAGDRVRQLGSGSAGAKRRVRAH